MEVGPIVIVEMKVPAKMSTSIYKYSKQLLHFTGKNEISLKLNKIF